MLQIRKCYYERILLTCSSLAKYLAFKINYKKIISCPTKILVFTYADFEGDVRTLLVDIP